VYSRSSSGVPRDAQRKRRHVIQDRRFCSLPLASRVLTASCVMTNAPVDGSGVVFSSAQHVVSM
jgi:hypothetical protein